jgi:hypothetical protein
MTRRVSPIDRPCTCNNFRVEPPPSPHQCCPATEHQRACWLQLAEEEQYMESLPRGEEKDAIRDACSQHKVAANPNPGCLSVLPPIGAWQILIAMQRES